MTYGIANGALFTGSRYFVAGTVCKIFTSQTCLGAGRVERNNSFFGFFSINLILC